MEFNYFNISLFIGGVVALAAGLFPYLTSRTKTNRSWLFLNIAVSVWSFGYFSMISTDQKNIAWISQIILHFGATLIPVFYLHFILGITGKIEKYKNNLRSIYIFSFFLLTLVPTRLYISDVVPKFIFKYIVDAGPLYIYFTIYFWTVVICGALILLKTCFEKKGIERLQLIYLAVAQIGFLGGGSVFFLTFNINIPPYLLSFFAIYPILITYAISRHHLFELRVVATEFFIFTIWIFLLIRVLLSINNTQESIINLIILFSVLFFGVLLMRSATKEIKQKEELEKLAKEIKVAYEVEKTAHLTEKKAREELETLDIAKDQFLLAIEHHLRTPLTAMLGYSDILLNGAVGKQPKKQKEITEKFQVSTKSLIKMVNDFLDVTQFQLGKEVITLKEGVDIVSIINEIISDLKFEIEKKKIYLNLEKTDEVFQISADREKLKAGLYNLVDNAVKYTNNGGVVVKIEKNNAKNILKIIIKDTGIGILPQNIPTLFGKTFERGSEAKKVFTTGRGIGVYIAGKIVKAHKGNIKVESLGEGKGSTFTIELPITQIV